METNATSRRLHPLIAGASVSVMLVSLLGAAAITGLLPSSRSDNAPAAPAAAVQAAVSKDDMPSKAEVAAPDEKREAAPRTVYRKPAVSRQRVVREQPVVYAQAEPRRYDPPQYGAQPTYPAPVYPQPAPTAKNSPLGIGIGAVVGGVLGNQVGKGNGRTAATIAGAIGGGYIGNEIAKRNQ